MVGQVVSDRVERGLNAFDVLLGRDVYPRARVGENKALDSVDGCIVGLVLFAAAWVLLIGVVVAVLVKRGLDCPCRPGSIDGDAANG